MSLSNAFQFTYLPNLDVLGVRWLADSALPQLAAEYEQALGAGLLHDTANWLLDVRQRPTADPEALAWLTNEAAD